MDMLSAYDELSKLNENQLFLNTQYVFDIILEKNLSAAEKDELLDKILDEAAEDIIDERFERFGVNAKVGGHFKIADKEDYDNIISGKRFGNFTKVADAESFVPDDQHLFFGLDIVRERTTGSLPVIRFIMEDILYLLNFNDLCSINRLYRSSYIPSNSAGEQAGWLDTKDLKLKDHRRNGRLL